MPRYLVTWNPLGSAERGEFRGQVVASEERARAFRRSLAEQGYRARIWQQLEVAPETERARAREQVGG